MSKLVADFELLQSKKVSRMESKQCDEEDDEARPMFKHEVNLNREAAAGESAESKERRERLIELKKYHQMTQEYMTKLEK